MCRVLVTMVKKSPLAGAVGMRSEIDRMFALAVNLTVSPGPAAPGPWAAHTHVKPSSRALGACRTA